MADNFVQYFSHSFLGNEIILHLCLGSTQWFDWFAAPVFQQCCMKVELSAQSYAGIINVYKHKFLYCHILYRF